MKRLTTTTLSFMICVLSFVNAQAAINLGVSPLSGGNSLRFGRISSGEEESQEVRIRVSSGDGTQYQVFQRLVDSFANEKNVPLGGDVISTYTLLGSNASGTLYGQNVEQMGFSEQLLYTSGSGGQSDHFTVAYIINGSRINATGKFLGRIQYIGRPVSGSSQDDVILNVTFEAPANDLKIEVEGSSTPDSVRLKFKGDRDQEGQVRLSFRGNLAQEIRVSQETEIFPQDELFTEIGRDTIMLTASGSTKGKLFPNSPSGLTQKRMLVYSSEENEDTFYVNFALNQEAIERQKAGVYKGRLKYIVEAGQIEQQFNIDLEVEIDPIFAIEVDLPPGGLHFDELLPKGQPIIRKVNVEITTNLGKRYMVTQHVASALTNEKGDVVPGEYFTIKEELLDGQLGKVAHDDFGPVRTGEETIFYSDNKGSPSQFDVAYRLRPFPRMSAGGYSTAIRFSLGEL